jgi:hypothetical protein
MDRPSSPALTKADMEIVMSAFGFDDADEFTQFVRRHQFIADTGRKPSIPDPKSHRPLQPGSGHRRSPQPGGPVKPIQGTTPPPRRGPGIIYGGGRA